MAEEKDRFKKIFDYSIGCIGLIGVLVAVIALFVILRSPSVVIQLIEKVSNLQTSTPIVIVVTPKVITSLAPTETPKIAVSQPTTRVLTPTPIETQSPTKTPTPTPVILFEDNFDEGDFTGWTIISGEPISTNGRLNALSDEVKMSVGDSSWKNYQVEFDLYNTGVIISNLQDLSEIVGFHVQDTRNMIGFYYETNIAEWRIVEDDVVSKVSDTMYSPDMQNFPYKFTFVIQNNFYKVNNGPGFHLTKFPTGGVLLVFHKGTIIDNFRVIALP